MTKQEMRKFAQEQISYYQSEIEWTEKQISKINDELKIARKEDKEQKAFAQTYMDGKYAASYEGNYQSEETKKLVNLRRKYQRWIKQYQAHIAHYEQEVIKYTEEANEEAQEATNTNDTKSESEEETTMKNTSKIKFEIREIDAWNYGEDEGWIWNTSYHMGVMVTKAKDEKKAFTAWMKHHLGISFKPNRTLIEYDGDVYTIIDRKTKEPLFAAIPNC